jgi:aspartyl-tRNA(Asn)/glutamyl-tRNA(Gln) amidotransferase subunit A
VAFASSLDQIGPITKTVQDAAMMLNAIAGPDARDATSASLPAPDFSRAFRRKDLRRVKVGVPTEFFGEGLDPEVEESVRSAIEELQQNGAEIKEVSLPTTPAAVATYYLIATAEASSNLARYDGVRFGVRGKHSENLIDLYLKTRQEGFGPEVKRRIMLGTYALSAGYYDAYYAKAQAVRTLLRRDFAQVFKEVDMLAAPVTPTPAFKLGEKVNDPLHMYLSDIYTISVNLAGLPAMSLPCGFSKAGLPIGLQLVGKPFDEEMLLRAGQVYEVATEWGKKRPVLRS